jgi:hypothetical protein
LQSKLALTSYLSTSESQVLGLLVCTTRYAYNYFDELTLLSPHTHAHRWDFDWNCFKIYKLVWRAWTWTTLQSSPFPLENKSLTFSYSRFTTVQVYPAPLVSLLGTLPNSPCGFSLCSFHCGSQTLLCPLSPQPLGTFTDYLTCFPLPQASATSPCVLLHQDPILLVPSVP